MDSADEKQKLLSAVVVAADETEAPLKSTQLPVATTAPTFQQEREWDGSLLQCCGSGDRHGLSAFASTLLCLPCTMAHNVRAALPGKGTKKIFLLVALAITVHLAYNGQVELTRHICEPFGPPRPEPVPHPKRPELPGHHGDPESKVFLAGATFNPEFLPEGDLIAAEPQLPEQPIDQPQQPETEETGFTIMVNGQPIDMNEAEATNAQIMLAKNEALEGMAQLSIAGRKLLHKHHHDDDEEEWKHKKHDKKAKKHEEEDDDDDDDDDSDDDDDDDEETFEAETFEVRKGDKKHPPHHPHHHLTEEEQLHMCHEARRNETFWFWAMEFFWALLIVYGYKMRKAIRKQLNIKGSGFRDYLSWAFCYPCAVCQETRTITKNNVVNGVWHNPTILVAPQDQSMPAPPAKELPV